MAKLELCDVGLTYPVYGARSYLSGGALTLARAGGTIGRGHWGRLEVEALADISLAAEDGDRIGILGPNGAGKTTLLKVVAGILRPNRGRIARTGKTVAVINPSVGLDPELTGRENIRQIAMLYGLTSVEIAELHPDVEAFTELGDFLDLPVATYSAGMITRLAFGVVTGIHPEILVADENIGTGDASFLQKAHERMQAMMGRASILLLATHSTQTIERLCNRAILMNHGRLLYDGGVQDVIERYQKDTQGASL